MAYEDRFGDTDEEATDFDAMTDAELTQFARDIRGDLVQGEISSDTLRAMVAMYGGLGGAWDQFLYESRQDWREREALQAAAQNAPYLRILADRMAELDEASGYDPMLPVPVVMLNIAGHSWSIYDHLNNNGVPAIYDDGRHNGIHALTQYGHDILPGSENSWYTDHFVASCAELAGASCARPDAARVRTFSEWQQRARHTLVIATCLANERQEYGWEKLAGEINPPILRGHLAGQADTYQPFLIDTFSPLLFEGRGANIDADLLTMQVSPRITQETGVRILRIYLIRPEDQTSVN